MKKLLPFLKKYRKECFLAPFFKLLEAVFELFVPLVVASIIDEGLAAGDKAFITRRVLLMILLGLVGFGVAVMAQFFSAKAATGFAAAVRSRVFAHAQSLSFSEIDRLGVPTLINRLTGDVNQLQTGVNLFLRLFLRSPFIVFGAMIMAFTLDAAAARIFLLVIILLFAVVFAIMLVSIPLYKKVQARTDTLLGRTRENLTGIRVLRAFCKEDAQIAAFKSENRALVGFQKFVGKISALMNPLTLVLVNLAVLQLIRTGAVRVDAGLMTQGTVVALYNYMSQILVELIKFANLIITLTKSFACADRIAVLLDIPARETAGETTEIDENAPAISFDDVSFSYDGAGEPALRHISFSAKKGETVGIIGGTGSGKSTLAALIARFYAATDGTVDFCGEDILHYPEAELRRRMAVVLQKSVLFRGTLRENMQWEKADATDEEIEDALRTAQALEVVQSKAAGLDEEVQQGGRNFSGGQRQRLSIARALVKKAEVLILDDSSSALDYATEAKLRTALAALSGRMTLFVISQRASAVMHADKILVLDNGELVGIGTHDSLLRDCAVYREIYASQSSKEAVVNA